MIEFEFNQQAAPQARSGRFTFGNGWARLPTHFPNLTSRFEREMLVDTINTLLRNGEPLLPHLGGVVVESQHVPEVLDGTQGVTQRDLSGDDIDFTTFWDVLDILKRNLVIDPNTDRILYSMYRGNIESIREYLPRSVVDLARDLNVEESDINHQGAYEHFKNGIASDELVRGNLNLQREHDSHLRIPPYYSIDAETLQEDINQNINMFKIMENLLDDGEIGRIAPVIPIRGSVLTLEPTREGDRLVPPQEWLDIINAYRELEPDLIFIKATNVEMDPNILNKSDSDGIFGFFTLLRRFTSTPTFFLGLDEFSYILNAHGLDGCSHPLYKSPYRTPKRGGSNGTNHRNFLIRRELGRVKFDQLDSLGCNGPFCRGYNGEIHPSDIPLPEQDQLPKCATGR